MPRRNQRGPSTPRNRAGPPHRLRRRRLAGLGRRRRHDRAGQLGPNGPSTSRSDPPWPEALVARSSRTLSQMPAARGAANADTCSRDSPARRVAADDLLLGVQFDPQVHAGQRGQPERAEVDPRQAVLGCVGDVPGSGGGGHLALAVLRLRRTPRSRRLRSIRLRRRPNGMSDTAPRERPAADALAGRAVTAGASLARRAAPRPGRIGPGPPAGRPAGRSGHRGAA